MKSKNSHRRAATFSRGIQSLPYLREFLGVDEVSMLPLLHGREDVVMVVGWGRKKNTAKARRFARWHGLPFYALEDGFLRSVGLGGQGQPSLSLVIDADGIYYDARSPSSLENILNGDDSPFTADLMRTARQAMVLIVEHHVSKYNGAPDAPPGLFEHDRQGSASCAARAIGGRSGEKRVLVVDQAAGDLSLEYGLPTGFDLGEIINTAKAENPNAEIFVKLHPETIAGLREGLFARFRGDPAIRLIEEDWNPISVLKQVDRVYVATSLMGFEALMLGKQVVCFGTPFYAGWGLTDDRTPCDRRRRRRSVEEVFAAAYILYCRYIDPATGRRCGILEVLDHLIRAIHYENLNRADVYCFGIRHWTRCNVLPYLRSANNRVFFVKTAAEARKQGLKRGSQLVIWGSRDPAGLAELAEETGRPPWRMEDGFLRSVGLGSDLVRPSSLVLDARGIYYDPSRPSELEHILATTEFTQQQLTQASRVRQMIANARISKYNTAPHTDLALRKAEDRRVVLVPGQVADDASVRLGCAEPATNLELLREVRARERDAFIIYRPHPDVVSGNRRGAVDSAEAMQYCDLIGADVSIDSHLRVADEVHTMTSLCGFDALLRGKKVVTYGRPFYAGWGLTIDRLPIPRRMRRLHIDELVAGTLLVYPRYYDWEAKCWTDCENVLYKLVDQRRKAEIATGGDRLQPSYPLRQMRKLRLLIKGLVAAT